MAKDKKQKKDKEKKEKKNQDKKNQKKLVIIGAGPGGYAAAFRAADLGLKVTLIGSEGEPGGTCLFHGCIPAKTLLELLKIKEEAAKVGDMGIKFEAPKIDLKKIAKWKNKVIKELTEGIGVLAKDRKVEYIQGKASFVSEEEIEIENEDGQKSKLQFDHVIIATGSRAKELPNVKFDHKKVLNSKDALELKVIPKSMLVIGGGYIGPELGSVYSTLGSKVSLVEEGPRVLPWVDSDLVKIFEEENKPLFEEVFFDSSIEELKVEKDKVLVKMKSEKVGWEKEYDLVLLAMGRIPNTEGLNLEQVGVEIDKNGFVKVNKKRITSNKKIYAIGDVTQKPLFANKAEHEGKLAADVISGKKKGKFKPKAIPSVVTTTKAEIAWCGLQENEAEEKGKKVKISRFPWTASGKANFMNDPNGMTKLIFDEESGKLLGGGVVGKKAGSLISEISLAIELGATAEDISKVIHPHPTFSESIMEAAELFSGSATHLEEMEKKGKPKKPKKAKKKK